MNNKTLKSCPFCGGIDEVHLQKLCDMDGERWEVMCEGCGAETFIFDTTEEAVEAWNKRVEPTNHGKWIKQPEDWRNQVIGNKCSVCGWVYFGDFYNYCPNCGVKMGAEK